MLEILNFSLSSDSYCVKLGKVLNDLGLMVVSVKRGRFRDLCIVSIEGNVRVYDVSVFLGRDLYKPWFEIHPFTKSTGISRDHVMGDIDNIVKIFSKVINKGGKAMIPYLWDEATIRILDQGYPEESSDIGYILVKNNYPLLANMYFPEGFNEGSPKLIGESIDRNNRWYYRSLFSRINNLEKIYREICNTGNLNSSESSICINLYNSLNIFKNIVNNLNNI